MMEKEQLGFYQSIELFQEDTAAKISISKQKISFVKS
jgi:hypothetical protein